MINHLENGVEKIVGAYPAPPILWEADARHCGDKINFGILWAQQNSLQRRDIQAIPKALRQEESDDEKNQHQQASRMD